MKMIMTANMGAMKIINFDDLSVSPIISEIPDVSAILYLKMSKRC